MHYAGHLRRLLFRLFSHFPGTFHTVIGAALQISLACLIQRIAAIRKLQLYNALNPRIDPVSQPPRPPDRREFRYVCTVWPQKPAAVRLSRH